MKIQYIGIAGRAGSGKSTAAFLAAADFQDVVIMSLADPIKDMTQNLLNDCGIPRDAPKEDVIPTLGVSPRRLMQTLGTEWGRVCLGEDFWLRAFEQRVRGMVTEIMQMDAGRRPQLLRIIVPDVRFPNEADWFTDEAHPERGLIALTNGSRRGSEAALGGQESLHISETLFHHVRAKAHIAIANEPTMGMPELSTNMNAAIMALDYRRENGNLPTGENARG